MQFEAFREDKDEWQEAPIRKGSNIVYRYGKAVEEHQLTAEKAVLPKTISSSRILPTLPG